MINKKFIKIPFIFLLIILSVFISSATLINYADKIPYFEQKILKTVNNQIYTDYQTAIFDNFCGSFKEFILKNNTPELLKNLYRNLDLESKEKLDINLNAILNVPDGKYMQYFYFKSSKFNRDFRAKLNTFHAQTSFEQERSQIMRKYKLPKDAEYIYGVFYDHHNLRFAPEKVREYIKDKIFLDIGAYVGDSVLVLLN